ncbi:signal recognition particle-docking protein FtsY, partial [bacterium]|nr:signal recognition particle-docking protein FtsY [bacterium]
SDLKQALCTELKSLFPPDKSISECRVFLLVGVNGSGKTTLAAKLAHRLQKEGKSVMLVAADTFRAAAQDQLEVWGTRLNVPVVRGIDGQDPASVVFQGCKEAKENNIDAVIVDTAGRLQTRVNLMKELEKINKVIERHFPNELICTLLTVDAMLGQNSLEQARLFQESTQLDGIVLTKMDGTGKGGIAFAIAHTLKISVQAISFGETVEDLRQFDAQAFVQELVNG